MPLRALLFDFDGLVVDTESPHYEAWCEPFTERGVELALERWQRIVGTHDSSWSPVTELAELTGQDVDAEQVSAEVDARYHERLEAAACMPGVLELVAEARAAGVKVAIASSSRHTWAERHLARLGIRDRFDAVVGRDLAGGKAKPDPAVYLEALRRLQVAASDALALEDSAHGVRAAVAAGVPVVAVPNPITASMDFSGALEVLDSLGGTTLRDLRALHGGQSRTG